MSYYEFPILKRRNEEFTAKGAVAFNCRLRAERGGRGSEGGEIEGVKGAEKGEGKGDSDRGRGDLR